MPQQVIERGTNWIRFYANDTGFAGLDSVMLTAVHDYSSLEVRGKCWGHAEANLTLDQLIALRDFLQEVL